MSTKVPEATTITVEQYLYERVKKSDVEIRIPNEPLFFQEYNHRIVVGLFPERETWDDNKVWQLQIIEIAEGDITKTFMRTLPRDLSDIISRFDLKGKSREEILIDRVVRHLLHHYDEDRITKEQFLEKYGQALADLSAIINPS